MEASASASKSCMDESRACTVSVDMSWPRTAMLIHLLEISKMDEKMPPLRGFVAVKMNSNHTMAMSFTSISYNPTGIP